MKISRIPSVAVALGIGALAVTIAGSAVAVPSVHAKISGSSIKEHSIAGNRLKNGAVTGKQIKTNSVTGKQVKESTLGTVPNAAKLGGLPASSYVGGARVFHKILVMTAGEATQTLGTFGPLTFTANCFTNLGATNGTVFAKTSQPLVVQFAMSPVMAFAPTDSAQEVGGLGEPGPAEDFAAPFAYNATGSFVLDGVDPINIVVNQPAGSCLFIANLVNHGS